ncbi:MAG: ATP-binding protein, partial [Dehalobacter sp. 4CP]|nr:ATP-binding protein [Dehalobacter sp. 4CP]
MKAYGQVIDQLTTLKLKGVVRKIDEAVNEAESRQQSYIAFLNNLLAAELDYRIEKKYNRNMTGAHFPVVKEINT